MDRIHENYIYLFIWLNNSVDRNSSSNFSPYIYYEMFQQIELNLQKMRTIFLFELTSKFVRVHFLYRLEG